MADERDDRDPVEPSAAPDPPGAADAPAERAAFTGAEEAAIRAAYGETGRARCPRCDVPLGARAIGGGSFGLGYARRREWLICPRCRRSAIFDLRRGTRN